MFISVEMFCLLIFNQEKQTVFILVIFSFFFFSDYTQTEERIHDK